MTSGRERDLSVPSAGDEIEPAEEAPEAIAPVDGALPAEGGEKESPAAAASEILTDVAALTAERDEYLAALQRSQADFANYRKRVVRQQEEQGNRAVLDLMAKILPVLDTLDLAMAHLAKAGDPVDGAPPEGSSDEGRALFQARTQLLDTLAKEGLDRVDAIGVPFDPAVHDAVAHAEADADDGSGPVIDEVMRSGYRWRGRTLRPAMVRVRG
jgi:molecular chaperone GrpE